MDQMQKKRVKTQTAGFGPKPHNAQLASHENRKRQNSNGSMPVVSPEQIYSQVNLKSEARQPSKGKDISKTIIPSTTVSANSA